MLASNLLSQSSKLPSPLRLKREARILRSLHPKLSQYAALNLAAKAYGYSSYKAFLRDWEAHSSEASLYIVTLTARWLDRGSEARGLMQARVVLSEPWANFLPLEDRRRVGALRRFHIVNKDRKLLTAPEPFASFLSCAHYLSKAARRLVFIDAMRVLPASLAQTEEAFRGDPHEMLTSRYPNQDHESLWWSPRTGLHFILNEPYQIDLARQARVLESRGMVAFTAHEWTTHNPSGTLAQLIAPAADQVLLGELAQKSMALPERFRKIAFSDDEGRTLKIF